jgi:glyoxylase-like metal-dependent hydrolase (beta-lactamase superfamily II)
MFTVDMLPAAQGDCVWIEYGTPEHPHRILIDAGPSSAYAALKERLLAARERSPERRLHFELLIITHIDLDHIGGAIE